MPTPVELAAEITPRVTVVVSLQTLLGLDDDPGMLDGYGPVPAAMVRDLAEHGVWRCIAVDDTHGTVLGVGRSTYTPGYRPGGALRTFLADAAPTCAIPTCTTRAWRCDLDHRKPWQQGGPSCSCNVRPLCRRHHRLKTAGRITLTPDHPAHTAAADRRKPVLTPDHLTPTGPTRSHDPCHRSDSDRRDGSGRADEHGDHREPPGTWIVTTPAGRTYPARPHTPLTREGLHDPPPF